MEYFIRADRIHNGQQWLSPDTTIQFDGTGKIVQLLPYRHWQASYVPGILCPGFVNVHTHLELSHMKEAVPRSTGLIPFIQQIISKRNASDEERRAARHKAVDELLAEGVVAVGDIANTTDALDLRARGDLHWHSFLEVLGFNPDFAPQAMAKARQQRRAYESQEVPEGRELRQSIVPHAPYSVSEPLFRLIDADAPGSVISIHNQEMAAEDEFYRAGTGAVNDLLDGFGIDRSHFAPTGKSSLRSYLAGFSGDHPFVFVHNTFTTPEDIAFVQEHFPRSYWCLCPKANEYIEGRLPDIELFGRMNANICLGTDSLASNDRLSIVEEMNVLRKAYPGLDTGTMLRWATRNGAEALELEDVAGSLAPGLRPGLLQLEERDGMLSLKNRII